MFRIETFELQILFFAIISYLSLVLFIILFIYFVFDTVERFELVKAVKWMADPKQWFFTDELEKLIREYLMKLNGGNEVTELRFFQKKLSVEKIGLNKSMIEYLDRFREQEIACLSKIKFMETSVSWPQKSPSTWNFLKAIRFDHKKDFVTFFHIELCECEKKGLVEILEENIKDMHQMIKESGYNGKDNKEMKYETVFLNEMLLNIKSNLTNFVLGTRILHDFMQCFCEIQISSRDEQKKKVNKSKCNWFLKKLRYYCCSVACKQDFLIRIFRYLISILPRNWRIVFILCRIIKKYTKILQDEDISRRKQKSKYYIVKSKKNALINSNNQASYDFFIEFGKKLKKKDNCLHYDFYIFYTKFTQFALKLSQLQFCSIEKILDFDLIVDHYDRAYSIFDAKLNERYFNKSQNEINKTDMVNFFQIALLSRHSRIRESAKSPIKKLKNDLRNVTTNEHHIIKKYNMMKKVSEAHFNFDE